MFVHMTVVGMDAGHLNKVIEVSAAIQKVHHLPAGLRQSFLLESMDDPGQVIWLSFWDSPGEAKAFITSLGYADFLGKLQPFLLSGPEWHSYRSLEVPLDFTPGTNLEQPESR